MGVAMHEMIYRIGGCDRDGRDRVREGKELGDVRLHCLGDIRDIADEEGAA